MCTVTLIASKSSPGDFILTSNRDEAAERKTIPPRNYSENGTTMLYPKDETAGGTWIGISGHERLICLLNGGFENHVREEKYRKSRGVVVKDLLAVVDVDREIEKYDFRNIEPFSIILVEWKRDLRFLEFVWDGSVKHLKELDLKSHLWSSSPLYTPEMKELRITWFKEFSRSADPSAENLWEFHHTGGVGNKNLDLIMDRGFVKTKSITQVVKQGVILRMIYEDLSTRKITKVSFK